MPAITPTSHPVWRFIQTVWRITTMICYPCGLLFVALIHWPPTLYNAKKLVVSTTIVWACVDACFYLWFIQSAGPQAWSSGVRTAVQALWVLAVDITFLVIICGAAVLVTLFRRRDSTNRVFGWTTKDYPQDTKVKPAWKGKKIVILGNGPSLAKGEPLGKYIDEMDEVVRFNNFQTAVSGLGEWTGSKTTVHFSDTMLFPTYPEYSVPNAAIVLSLFMDRLIVSGSYVVFRSCIDLELSKCLKLFTNPGLGWVPHEDIENLKHILGLTKGKHPTSGCLAIDWFVRNRPDPNVPIYIHGFDFFEGDAIHYYDKSEPLYERINDLMGVTVMHQPGKEKGFVHKLIEEGKVKWLRDYAEGR